MRSKNHFFVPSLAFAGLCVLACCRVSTAGTGNTGPNRSDDRNEGTHGYAVEPNDSVVFPEDTADTITTEISPENRQTIPDDRTEPCGAFERIEETSSRHDAVMESLSTERGSNTTGVS